MFIFIIWIRLEACLFLGRRVSILSIQKCSVPSSCKSSCSAFHPYCKNFIVLRSHHDSEIEFVFDEFGAWSSNYIIRRWTGAGEGIWAGGCSLHQCRWWQLPPGSWLCSASTDDAPASPASQEHPVLSRAQASVRWRVKSQTGTAL